jgi:hypothetical protein
LHLCKFRLYFLALSTNWRVKVQKNLSFTDLL